MTTKNVSTHRLLAWFDEHLIEIMAGFLLAFLPLYPKWPLFDILPGYIVRVRLEDFLIGLALVIFGLQLLRRKVSLKNNPLFKPIIIYLVIGLISGISAVLITRTVPLEIPHVGKLALHWLRRIEYMSMAFIFFAAIKDRASLKRLMLILVATTFLISVYGLGQKYLSWPVYSTMNREFSKGWRLVLTENARVSSTFAGHYDLAAYAVVALTLLAALIILFKGKVRLPLIVTYTLTFAVLLLTASRTSFIALIAGLTVLCATLFKQLGFKKTLLTWMCFMFITAFGLFSFGSLYERFAHILMLDRIEKIITENVINKLQNHPIAGNIKLPNDMNLVVTPSDTPPTPVQTEPETSQLPPDVYEAIPENLPEASLSAIPETSGTGQEGKPRTYSDTAFEYGLSSAIRFDALWPRAIKGFKSNPLLGSGYSTLLKEQTTDFTEAESTDNDYLRALGETGLLGFLSFFGIFIFVLYLSLQAFKKTSDHLILAFLVTLIASIVGLLVNALYIDIFEASKIAYLVWALLGMGVGIITVTHKKS